MFSEEASKTETEKTATMAPRKTLAARNLRYDALLVFITMIWGCVAKNLRGKLKT